KWTLRGGPAGTLLFGLFALGNERGVDTIEDDGAVDEAFADVAAARQVVHDLEEDLLEDGAQAARSGATKQRLLGNGLERVGRELELDIVEFEHPLVLLDDRVLGLDEDANER